MNLQFLVRQRGRLPEKSPRACADAWKEAHVLCSAIYPGAHIFRVRPPIPDILYLSPAAAACAPVRAIRSPRPHACHRKMTEIFPISGIYLCRHRRAKFAEIGGELCRITDAYLA
jgi:hypothetical protein